MILSLLPEQCFQLLTKKTQTRTKTKTQTALSCASEKQCVRFLGGRKKEGQEKNTFFFACKSPGVIPRQDK